MSSLRLKTRLVEINIANQLLKHRKRCWSVCLMVALAMLEIGIQKVDVQALPYTATDLLSQQLSSTSSLNISATEFFRKVYENRYTWNKQFPGYTAAVEFKQGKENYKGQVRVNPDLSVEVTGINNEDIRKTLENLLSVNVVHRRQVPFEVAHKNSSFKYGATDKTGTVEIVAQGKIESRYKVLNQQIKQVNRLLGPHSVTVNTLDSIATPEGYLATRYRTTYYEPQTKQVVAEEESEDSYEKIGGYYVLSSEVIHTLEDGQHITTQLKFTDIKLVSGKS